ncbi:hypothetical protein GUJ93_ZPchr0002g25902 [Zizania palustris]|uniref:Uncharacterized protein n=1 Tax=Zizania palustris TaxID=103762 RepID=A0A8J5V4K0_ZIZPA|nr:hypothetical protein GUJ93_ZPchr0002g25902 [Zizania palustris]
MAKHMNFGSGESTLSPTCCINAKSPSCWAEQDAFFHSMDRIDVLLYFVRASCLAPACLLCQNSRNKSMPSHVGDGDHHPLPLVLPAPRPPAAAAAAAWRKSRMTGLRHLGQRGSASASMTYMKQRGQAASTIDVASGLSDHCIPPPPPCCSLSDDRHELGDDSSSSAARPGGGAPRAGSDRLSFRSSPLGPLPLLITQPVTCLTLHIHQHKQDLQLPQNGCGGLRDCSSTVFIGGNEQREEERSFGFLKCSSVEEYFDLIWLYYKPPFLLPR